MNIQIFGKSKCFDTKKAERWLDKLIDWTVKDPEIDLVRYMDDRRAKEDKVFENVRLMKTPVVRNGKQATVGYCPEVWENWE